MITNQDIIDAALRLACETGTSGENADYRERSLYLLPAVCSALLPADTTYRKAHGRSPVVLPEQTVCTASSAFPLSPAFASAAAASLASMLVMDESTALCDRLAEWSRSNVDSILSSLPFSTEPIVQCY